MDVSQNGTMGGAKCEFFSENYILWGMKWGLGGEGESGGCQSMANEEMAGPSVSLRVGVVDAFRAVALGRA